MPVIQSGQANLSALLVPDVYVQIQPPSENYLNGVPTNILGLVGTASWGPVNAPTTVSSLADQVQRFGNVQARKYDLGTMVWAAVLNGANNMRGVRVTDGTDTAAAGTLGATGLTITAKYTGTTGNIVTAGLAVGSKAGTWRATITLPGLLPEVFDNLAGGLTGNAVWVAIAAAINGGISGMRGASGIVIAAAGASVAAPTAGSVTLSGGTDGASGVTGSTLLGVDNIPRKGMYALRSTGCAVAALVDCDDSTTWSAQAAFGLAEGVYMVATGPAGDTISNAITTKATAGIDTYTMRLQFGDWMYFTDNVNGVTRLVSPQGFVCGVLAAMSPEQSALNKPMYGIINTQRGSQELKYSAAELLQLSQAGIDIITNPIPGGAVYGSRLGCNTSSNAATNGDNYTRMINYLAYTANAGMGKYVGQLQTPKLWEKARGTLNTFFTKLKDAEMIEAFSVQLDEKNNPPASVALGNLRADVKVRFLSITKNLLINLEGGQTVKVTVQ